ncbi:hypothetical protein [Streptomyces sp. NPDC094049]|uniref:DNA polymerase Y family protein n=1 Tax=Streptomyces sp. NPDC094049 TaxID=3154987 RepID=UPI0033207BDD
MTDEPRQRAVLYLHFGAVSEAEYGELLAHLQEFTPVVQSCPPDAALADLTGALRLFDRDAASLAALVRVRLTALFGDVRATLGLGPNPLLARIAAEDGPPGALRTAPGAPEDAPAYLAPLPLGRLPGCGPTSVRALRRLGLTTVGDLAAAPAVTLTRILGTATARHLRAAAHGIDPAPVRPAAPAVTLGAEHRFLRDELDPGRRHGALLGLADGLGLRLRTARQVAHGLVLTVRYADGSTTTRGRALPEPTAHGPALVHTATALHRSLGLQRARVRSLALRAEGLAPAEHATRQPTLDPGDERPHRLEAATDRLRALYGPDAVRPAAAWLRPPAPATAPGAVTPAAREAARPGPSRPRAAHLPPVGRVDPAA